MIRQVLIAAALAATPVAVTAQTPAPAATTTAKAHELLTVMHADELTRKTLDTQMQAMTGGLAERLLANTQLPAQVAHDPEFQAIMQRFLDRVAAQTTTAFKANLPKLMDTMAGIYARNFTVPQMDDMIAFYRTPTGQALLERMPTVTAEAATAGRDLTMGPAMKAAQEALPQFMSELKAWADKHPQAAGTITLGRIWLPT